MKNNKNRELLTEIINIRCTPSMRQKLEDISTAANLPLREVVRRKIMSLKIPHREQIVFINELRALRREVARQGGLIKHSYSISPICKEESSAALNKQTEIFTHIGLLLKKIEEGYLANDCGCRRKEI